MHRLITIKHFSHIHRPLPITGDFNLETAMKLNIYVFVSQELEHQKEELKGASGGLDELANILAITQVKLNKFKVDRGICNFKRDFNYSLCFQNVCGSIKNLFKLRGEGLDGQSDGEGQADDAAASSAPSARAVASVS